MDYKQFDISKQVFNDFVESHPNGDLIQLANWEKVKEPVWYAKRFAIGQEEVQACALLLFRKLPLLPYTICYIGHGFVADYSDTDLIKACLEEAIILAKKEGAIVIKIDPVIPREAGVHEQLLELGFKHRGFTYGMPDIQPRFNMIRALDNFEDDNQFFKSLNPNARRNVKKGQNLGLFFEEEQEDFIDEFYKLMQETGDRDHFSVRNKSYFQTMIDSMHPKYLKLYSVKLDIDKTTAFFNLEVNRMQEKIDTLMARLNAKNETIEINTKYLELMRQKKDLETNLDLIKGYEEKNPGKKVVYLASALVGFCGSKSYYLYAGSESYFRNMSRGAYYLLGELILHLKKEGYKSIDLGGVSGRTENLKNDPYAGLYLFKSMWTADLVERLGEYDYILNRPIFYLMDTVYPAARAFMRRLGRKKNKSNN